MLRTQAAGFAAFCPADWDTNVRFGSKADICAATSHVRFTPNSDRESSAKGNVRFTPKSGCGASTLCHGVTLSYRVIAMKTHLHITNGDVAADALKQSNIRGDVLPWRDPVVDGPFPAGLDLEATSKIRADYLSRPALPHDQVLRDFRLRDDHLATAAHYDGVTLWFEHDLLDQLQILQVLDSFADAEIGHIKLGIICVDAFPGILPFRGLGQLDPAQIATLIDKRVPVTLAQLELAQAGWAAFRSPDPREIETYLQQDLRVFPFMKAALLRHLQEIPSVSNGLGRTDQQILQLISDGIGRPGRLFAANMDLETNLFLGDWSFFQHIHSLCNVQQPLLRCDQRGVQIPTGACTAGGRLSPTTAVINRKRTPSPGGSS
jgi:hypothetical protein